MAPSPESPRAQLTRGLRAQNLALIRAASRQLGPLPLGTAFEVLMLIGLKEPDRWPAAAVRFVGRVALEQPDAALDDVIDLARALRDARAEDAEILRELGGDLSIDLHPALALWPPAGVAQRRG